MRKPVTLSRYLAGNLSLFAIPLLLASALSLWTIDSQARRSFVELSALSADLVSSRFAEFFARPHEAASHIADILERRDLYPRARLDEYLSEILAEFPYIARVQVIGADDRVEAVVPADPSMLGVSRAGELVYEKVKDSKGLRWSDSYISTRNNQPALTFGMRAGKELFLCDLSLDWVGDYAGALRVSSAPGVEVRITDGKGIYVSNLDRDRVSRRERMTDFGSLKAEAGKQALQTIREDGVDWLVTASWIAEPDWYVFILYPASAFSGTLALGYAQLIVLFAAVGIAGLLFWRFRFRRVADAMATISTEADRISLGNYGELEEFGAGFSEFRRVGMSLNGMVGAIGRRERVLLERERGFRETLERIDLLVAGVDREGRIAFVNPSFVKMSGYARVALMGKPLIDIMLPGDRGCPFARLLAGESILPLERCPIRCADGSARLVDWSIVANLDGEGGLSGATGIGYDVTESVRQQELVNASLREKEILLREVHHRVKNNLQIILSLLQLQLDETENPVVARALGLSADRILSIALVHETIYGSEDFADLEFGDYAFALVTQLLSRPEGRHIRLRTELEPLRLDLIDAVPCGLLVNEALRHLLDRAVKAGGAEPESVVLKVGMRSGMAFLSLRCGCPSGGLPSLSSGRGDPDLLLMQALAEQLHGELRLHQGTYIEVELRFQPRTTAVIT